GREPVALAGGVAEDLGEAEALEPPRGSGAHVSLAVMTVGHNWARRRQPGGGLAVQLPERDVDGARQVLLRVLLPGPHVDQLRPFLDQAADIPTLHLGWHCLPPQPLAAATGVGAALSIGARQHRPERPLPR